MAAADNAGADENGSLEQSSNRLTIRHLAHLLTSALIYPYPVR